MLRKRTRTFCRPGCRRESGAGDAGRRRRKIVAAVHKIRFDANSPPNGICWRYSHELYACRASFINFDGSGVSLSVMICLMFPITFAPAARRAFSTASKPRGDRGHWAEQFEKFVARGAEFARSAAFLKGLRSGSIVRWVTSSECLLMAGSARDSTISTALAWSRCEGSRDDLGSRKWPRRSRCRG